MKIIGINTSPRKGSNSRIALLKALETAESKGASVEIFDLNDLNITTCQADDYCRNHGGECCLDDDMQQIYDAIDESYGIVLATPVFMGNVSSNAKIFIDRLYAVLNGAGSSGVGKKFSLIASQAAIDPPMYEYIKHNLETTVDIFRGVGFDVEDVELLIGNSKENSIMSKEDQLNKAIMVGNKIVR